VFNERSGTVILTNVTVVLPSAETSRLLKILEAQKKR
jgi:hypothetical protein